MKCPDLRVSTLRCSTVSQQFAGWLASWVWFGQSKQEFPVKEFPTHSKEQCLLQVGWTASCKVKVNSSIVEILLNYHNDGS